MELSSPSANAASKAISLSAKPAAVRAGRLNGPRIEPLATPRIRCMKVGSGSRPSRSQHHANQWLPMATWRTSSAQDHFQDVGGTLVAETAQAHDHSRRDVQAARLEHARHQGHARETGVGGSFRHFPQAVVRLEVAVGGAQFAQPLREQAEVARLVHRDADPVQVVLPGHAAEAIGRVQRQVDRVELDVGDRMQQRGAAFLAAQSTLGQVARRDQAWSRRPARARESAPAPRPRPLGCKRPACRSSANCVDQRNLLERIACVKAIAHSLAQRFADAMAQDARRLSFDSSLRACCRRSK